MGGARDERKHEKRNTLASEECFERLGIQWWRIRSSYRSAWAIRGNKAIDSNGRARKAVLRFAAIQALVAFCFVSTAYAVEGFNSVIYGPVSYTWQNVTYSQYGVIASNKYNAAAVALGYNPDNFSAEVKAKLSNSSTGGSFYTIAQEFENPDPDGLSVTVQGVAPGFWATAYGLYGEGNVWYAELTKTAITSATEDLQAILNGGSLGGGSGGTDAPTKIMTLQLISTTLNRYFNVSTGNLYMASAPSTTTLTLTDDAYNNVMAKYNAGYDVFVKLPTYEGGRNQWAVFYFVPHGKLTYGETAATKGGGVLLNWRNLTGATITAYSLQLYLNVSSSSAGNYVYSGSTLYGSGTVNRTYMPNGDVWSPNGSANDNFGCYYVVFYADGTSSNPQQPVTPPTNWPDNPTVGTPEPPEVPGPVNDTPTPQPTGPTFVISPTFPTYTEVTTTNYTVDLQGILDAMNDHCIHLQDALHWNFDHFWTVLSTKWTNDLSTFKTFLDGQFGWIGDTIVEQMEQTRDYLKELFEWLADQFAFESGGSYNDSTVISWLKKIYSKLGTGSNSRPTDPVADPVETGSWLDTLINNLLTALNDLFPGLLNQVGEFFGGALGNLTSKFPFSIPWDVAAILGLLAANPVAPSVTIPAYTVDAHGLTQAGSYEIDLEDYEAAFGAVRLMMRIAFALYVCVHTKDFLDVIERVMM